MQLVADGDRKALLAVGIASVVVQIPFLERDEYTAGPGPVRTESDDARTARPRAKPDTSTAVLDAYTGHYYSAELDVTYVVHFMDGELRYRLEYSPANIQLTPIERDEWDADDATFRFLRDSSALITGFNLSSGRISDIYFEKTR